MWCVLSLASSSRGIVVASDCEILTRAYYDDEYNVWAYQATNRRMQRETRLGCEVTTINGTRG